MKKLRYNKKPTSRIPAVADASRRHLTARSGLEVMLYELLQHALVQKERRNDLPELTPQRARELYEAYRRGEMADVQLMWDQLEERDETLFTVLHARLGALAEMPWAVNIDADLAEDMQPLAEQQQELANKLLAAVENLPEALTHLGMADFRGVAALEVVGDLRGTIDDLRFANNGEPALAGESEAQATATARALGAATPLGGQSDPGAAAPASDSACLGEAEGRRREPNSINRTSYIVHRKSPLRWEVIEPWNLCRPVRRGPWYYNAEATSTPTRPEELDPAAVIIREAQPIDLPAMFLICAKYLSVHAWDAFLEVFGIPNIFLEMPPATPEGKAMEFDAIVQRLIGEGRGTVPSGAKFHTVETSKDNTQSFEARAKWCNEAIIQLATGGLLTVTTQSGSGTLAGNAHSDSFSRLCAASARSISAAINRQFLRPALQEAFPHTPILVQFELAPEPVDDRLQMAQLLGAINGAGFRPSAETVSELMNFEVQPVQEAAPEQPPVVNDGGLPAAAGNENISGSGVARPSETPGLGAVVANASNDLTQDDIAEAEPPLTAGELAALRALGGELNPEQVAADAEYMTREMLAGMEDSDELENRDYKRSSDGRFASTGAATHSHKGGRGSHGKKGLGKTGSPNLVEEGDSKRKQKKVLTKAFDKAKKGEKVETGYKVGSHELTLTPGDKAHWGSHHAERKPEHSKDIPAKKLAESTLHGPRVNDKDNDVTIEHKGRRVVFSPEKQPSKGKNEPLLPHKTNERKIGKNWYVT